MADAAATPRVTIVPANEASREDLQAADAGLAEVSRPTLRRVVMRIDF